MWKTKARTILSVEVCNGGLKSFEAITLPLPWLSDRSTSANLRFGVPGNRLEYLDGKGLSSRFMHVPELLRMGAEISLEGTSAIVRGGNAHERRDGFRP